jgi:hypothetical protein
MTTTQTSEPSAPDEGGISTASDYPPVVFIGKMGAGKSSAAKILADRRGYVPLSFATGVREAAVVMWGEEARNDRTILQKLGTDVARSIDPDVWANMLFRKLDANKTGVTVVNDDCRFPNEYWGLRERGFKVVRITAPLEQRVNRLIAIGKFTDRSQLTHESETALDDIVDSRGYDVNIGNPDGTDLESVVLETLEKLRDKS